MWASVPEMGKETDALLTEAIQLSYFSVAAELQNEAIAKLSDLACRIDAFRQQAVSRKDEDAANTAYAFFQYIAGMVDFLGMWIHLKSGDLEDAWARLVDAQGYIECGIRLLDNHSFRRVAQQLHQLEKALFPPQLFTSVSHQFGWAMCSICRQVYGECDHLAGKLYMGRMCGAVVQEIMNCDHVAVVLDPADKACRIPSWPDGDKMRCTLTKRIIGENDGVIKGVPLMRANWRDELADPETGSGSNEPRGKPEQ